MPTLFDPIAIRNLRLKNRVVMPAMTTRLATVDGAVTDGMVAYYQARARGGAGLVTVEMSSVHPSGKHRAHELGLVEDRFLAGLRRLTDAIKAHGARASIQLAHAGGYTPPGLTGLPSVAPSSLPYRVYERVVTVTHPLALTQAEIADLVTAFAAAAERARVAGFDLVEIHGAHGYLVGQFLSPLHNVRTDGYGGSLRNRARFALEILEACRSRVPALPVIFRFSADEYAPGGFSLADARELAPWLAEAGADALHVSAASYRSLPSPAVMIPPMTLPAGVFLPLARAVKGRVAVPVIAVGRLHDPELATRALEQGHADMVALGRALIADPDWPRKVEEGLAAQVRPCISCNTCVDSMRAGASIGCLVNPEAGRETAGPPAPAAPPRQVLVVGGGPAGLEAARLAAQRGHRVTLWEKQGHLGGQLRLAALGPVFQNVEADHGVLSGFIAYLAREARRAGVELRLRQEATPALVRALRPDVVIVATGARYRFPFNLLVPRLLGLRLLRTRPARRLLHHPAFQGAFYSVIRRPERSLAPASGASGLNVEVIGDAARLGKTMEALRQAASLAREI